MSQLVPNRSLFQSRIDFRIRELDCVFRPLDFAFSAFFRQLVDTCCRESLACITVGLRLSDELAVHIKHIDHRRIAQIVADPYLVFVILRQLG